MVGINDITELARWAWKIYHSASSEYTCAHQEYQDFVNDIDTLQRALSALKDAAAGNSTSDQPLLLSTNFVEAIIREARAILQSCDRLLSRNPFFKTSRGAVTNILWDVSVKEDVGKLQTRVQICFQKANFALTRLEVNNQEAALLLLAQNQSFEHDALHSLLQRVADQVGVPPRLPTSALLSDTMRRKFLSVEQSRRGNHTTSIASRLDALIVFYDRSTHTFNSQPPIMTIPPTTQYLNLLKCLYLIDEITSDSDFRRYVQRPMTGAWYRCNVSKVDREARRFLDRDAGIEQVPDEELLRQIEDEFIVDLRYLQDQSTSVTLESSLIEDVLYRRWLVPTDRASAEQLSISRINAGRLRFMRIISTTTQGHNVATRVHEHEIDLQSFVLDPLYAASPQTAANMVWRSASADRVLHALQFIDMERAHEFQRAVTNHMIVIDHKSLASARMVRGFTDGSGKPIAETSRIQIWSYKDPSHDHSDAARRESMATQSPISSESSGADTIATFTQRSLRLPSDTTALRGRQGINQLVRPVPYQVVIMTTVKHIKSLISIRIDENTKVNPDKCQCSKRNSTCEEIFLEHTKKALQLIIADPCNGNGQIAWNLALFGKFDDKSKHNDLKFAREERAKHVVLRFTDVSARRAFAEKLEDACLLIRQRYNDYVATANAVRGLATVAL